MENYIYWFLLALSLLIFEIVTGTFYMLVLSLAVAIGGVTAWLGLGFPLQLFLCATAGILGIVLLRRLKTATPADTSSQNLDIGQPVQVIAWRESGTARVHYRGAQWDAEPESADTPHSATMYIRAIRGSVLILTQHKSS